MGNLFFSRKTAENLSIHVLLAASSWAHGGALETLLADNQILS